MWRRVAVVFLFFCTCGMQAQSLPPGDDMKGVMQALVATQGLNDAETDSLMNAFVRQCDSFERHWLKNQVVMRLYNASLPVEPTGRLREEMKQIGVLVGEPAPGFGVGTDSLLEMKGRKLLFFYESSCNICHQELGKLEREYQSLPLTLISIDCNGNRQGKQLWQYDLADPDGRIYIPYGVLKTPTFCLIDEEGLFRGRYFRLEDVEL